MILRALSLEVIFTFFIKVSYAEEPVDIWSIESNPQNKKINKLWELNNRLDSHYATPVRFKDHLIGYHGRQETGTEIRCIESSTGKIKWSSNRVPAGSITLANKTLIILSIEGIN